MCGHDSAYGMRFRSQQQVPNFVSQHVTQQSVAQPVLFSDLLRVVKSISVIAGAFVIH